MKLKTQAATSFQDRIDEAIRRVGGQTALAKLVTAAGDACTTQAIQNLARRSGKRAPARNSKLTPTIAKVTGLSVEWLASGRGPMDAVPATSKSGVLESTQEIEGVELTKAAIEVAKAFMDLPRNLRDEYKQKIETEALRYSARVNDEKLGDLAAPKRVKGTQ